MNILPKKKWHVRTKENIARVRRDEAEAAEKEKERLRRVALAEQEHRTAILRGRTGGDGNAVEGAADALPVAGQETSIVSVSGHINLFQDLEDGDTTAGDNPEHLQEKREEREKYEKSIGLLTYLGQDSGGKQWFNELPKRGAEVAQGAEVRRDVKLRDDPLTLFAPKKTSRSDSTSAPPTKSIASVSVQPALPPVVTAVSSRPHKPQAVEAAPKRKLKKRKRERSVSPSPKKSSKKRRRDKKEGKKKKTKKRKRVISSESGDDASSDDEEEAAEVRRIRLERLREERLTREAAERKRTEQLLRKLRGEEAEESPAPAQPPQPKYSSQFNPHLARQNFTSDR